MHVFYTPDIATSCEMPEEEAGHCLRVLRLTTGDEVNPINRIIKAIKASAAHDIYVDYPIVLTNTKDTEFIVIDENNIDSHIK